MQLSGAACVVSDYRVVEATNSSQLNDVVSSYLSQGWTIVGPHSVATLASVGDYPIWSQTLIKLV